MICGTLKDFLRNLTEPLVTFALHEAFSDAASKSLICLILEMLFVWRAGLCFGAHLGVACRVQALAGLCFGAHLGVACRVQALAGLCFVAHLGVACRVQALSVW